CAASTSPTSRMPRWSISTASRPWSSPRTRPKATRPGARSASRPSRGGDVDLALTEPQEMLKASARTFIEREAPPHTIVALQRADSGLVPDLWRKACDAGWLGILIPSEYGGSESSVTDAAVLYEELGRGPL